MSLKNKLEKSAKSISRFSGLLGESLSSILPLMDANVYFHVIDENTTSYTLEIRNLAAKVTEGKIEPTTLEMVAPAENFLAFLDGKLSFAEAWVNDKIKLKGVRSNLMNALLIGMIVGGL